MSASIFKESKPKLDKVLQENKTNKTNKTNDYFSDKNKLSISESNFTKSEGKVRFGQFFFENNPLDKPKKMQTNKKLYLFRKLVNNAKW